jgi:hypothetical protein
MMLFEIRLDVELNRELDRLASRACRRDDDHASCRWLRLYERVVIGDVVVVDAAGHGRMGDLGD